MTLLDKKLGYLKEDNIQDRLDALMGSNNNIFTENTWVFLGHNGRLIRIDFNDQYNLCDKYPDWSIGTEDWILITKIVWIYISSSLKPHRYAASLQGTKLLWAVMGRYDISIITRDKVPILLDFFLMYGWRNGCESKNFELKSYPRFIESLKIREWKRAFSYLGLNFISSDVTEDFIKSRIKKLVPSLTEGELTYKDWFSGKSFNCLGLDKGRYYVEHSLSVFDDNYPLAIALVNTFNITPDLASSLGCSLSSLNQVLSLTLQGSTVKDLSLRIPSSSLATLESMHQEITSYFQRHFKQARFERALLDDEFIKEALIGCGLNTKQESIDRFRVILWEWMQGRDKNGVVDLLDGCQNSVSIEALEKIIYTLKNKLDSQQVPIFSEQYYKNLGLYKYMGVNRPSYLRQLIDYISKAGLINVVALTGWRKSEFGFPISAINRERNEDKLDQYSFPWRYRVDWYVQKTNGKVKQKREITFNIFMLLEKLNLLHGANNDAPCLYTLTKSNSNPQESGEKVTTAVISLWGHFVENYIGFKEQDDIWLWKRLTRLEESGKVLINSDKKELKRLLAKRTREQWGTINVDLNLKDTWLQVRKEWPLTEFKSSSSLRARRGWLSKYRNRSLRPDWINLLDENLSGDVKDWINSLTEDELRAPAVGTTVLNHMMEGCIYPNPHSFRHMWVEAVYRRFDGDAGWMIRSQFKHISRTMWLAYIRDKDNRYNHEQAKQQVISSLLRNYLLNKGKGYSGQMHIWLRRLIKKTKIMTPQEQKAYVEHLTSIEIDNLKASPWGYCLLKRRTKSKAKCSQMGEPMRHNASPDLCLGCTHNLMQSENVEWSLLHIASHIEAIRNPVVPSIFKESSYKLVKYVTKHVKTLNPNHEALIELQEVMDIYKVGRVD